jgi:hypothetical protein
MYPPEVRLKVQCGAFSVQSGLPGGRPTSPLDAKEPRACACTTRGSAWQGTPGHVNDAEGDR